MSVPLEEEGITFSSYEAVRQALFHRELEQHAHKHYEKGNLLEDVVMQLHVPEHRARRRVENPLFRRDAVLAYERDRIPTIINDNLDRMLAAGLDDVMAIGHMLTVVLSAEISGIDLDATDLDEVRRMVELERVFATGASITDSTRDKQEIITEVQAALRDFDREFYRRSLARRQAHIDGRAEGPPADDLLSRLLVAQEELGMGDALVLRETAFILESGSHTSALTLAQTMLELFGWRYDHPDLWCAQGVDDGVSMEFLQRCVAETVRLHPIIPITRRKARVDLVIDDVAVPAGSIVYLDNVAANRDPSVFTDRPSEFDPLRAVPKGVQAFAHGFGGGMHTCIGRVLAMGVPDGHGADRVFGEVALIARALLDRGVELDPDRPPVTDASTHRERLAAFPVRFARPRMPEAGGGC